MTTEDYKKLLPSLPSDPGVYRYIDKQDVVIYVGKAKNLKKRIASYFGDKKHQAHKTKVMVKNAARITYTIVETEQDALLLEASLIKKFQPRYNVMLKDGKTYVYLMIKKERFPRVIMTRRVIKDGSLYFGPYTSKHRANILYDLVKKLFKLRTCNLNLSQTNIDKGEFKVCLEYHIGNCLGPCVAYQEEIDYRRKIEQVKNILKGNFKEAREFINSEMLFYADKLEFEKAEEWKSKLEVFQDYQSKSAVVSTTIKDVDVFYFQEDEKKAYINYLKVIDGSIINTSDIELEKNLNTDKEYLLSYAILELREKFNSIAPEIIIPFPITYLNDVDLTIPKIGDKKKLMDLAEKNLKYALFQKKKLELNKIKKKTPTERILKTLQSDLNMDEVPFHIECFDNSNIQGTNPTASCVVFKNAKPAKRDYRHFKIKTVVGPDDFASMEEVVYRRYRRLLEEKQDLPQLIVIDGGKGQLSSAVKSLKKLDLFGKITIVGIAKRLEEIYFPGDSVPLYINKKSESLKVIQQIRNEAHRFAITLHRNIRSKKALGTELTNIDGIGQVTANKLLTHFKSVKKVKEAEGEELVRLVGLKLAKRLKDYFKEEDK